ncbi:hypothetical protein, partial [Escherichia coli]|uniref:hypothetical protein n=1 Tax=Escherichia coli TaxID=562 RepID=UPI001BB47DF6
AAPSAKGDDKFITTDYLQQCLKNYGELSDLRLALFLFFCRSGLSRASDTSGAGDGFLMRVSAWEAPCAGAPRSEARTKKALRLQP